MDLFGLEGRREVFRRVLWFPLNNTFWCYLVLVSLFPYSLGFTFIVYAYALQSSSSFITLHLLLFHELVKEKVVLYLGGELA